jgi:proline racemase
VSVAFGGALYAALPASSVGLAVEPAHLADLIALSREIQAELEASEHASHPSDPRLSGIYGVIWFDDLGGDADNLHQRNVTVFADGEVDRSPCGSGTAARVATLVAQGQLSDSGTLRHDSIVGTTFLGRVVDVLDGCVVPQVTGMAYRTGEHVFVVDSRDPLVPGFTLR